MNNSHRACRVWRFYTDPCFIVQDTESGGETADADSAERDTQESDPEVTQTTHSGLSLYDWPALKRVQKKRKPYE